MLSSEEQNELGDRGSTTLSTLKGHRQEETKTLAPGGGPTPQHPTPVLE